MQKRPRHYLPLILALSAIALVQCAPSDHTVILPKQERVISTSLCGDTYLQAFTPAHIAGLSWQSRSALSRATPSQKNLPQFNDSLERLLPYSDALVLFGPGEGFGLTASLPQSHSLTWTESFKGVYENALSISAALNLTPKKAETWYARIQRLEQERQSQQSKSPKILYLTPAGGSAGPGTFVDAVIHLSGGQNINQTSGWHSPNLETLLSYKPDLLLRSFNHNNYHSRGNTQNPVLERHFKDVPVIDIAGKYWPCAGPGLLDAALILQEAIISWQEDTMAHTQ